MPARLIDQQQCVNEIDYSQITVNERILPFVIELDTSTSVLDPGPGQNQRFCYHITGVGEDSSTFANLSHLVLGICPGIRADQITNITVVRDGVTETVTFPGNVELFPPDNPDPPTGCPGLKFNFGLNKVNGVMDICFELTTAFPVGPDPVCLFGADRTASGLSICGPSCGESGNCQTTVFQPVTVCLPITITPFAFALETTTFCCGDPIIAPGTCTGTMRSCTFTITQTLCCAVPVEFGAVASAGDPSTVCGDATSTDVCTGCNDDGIATPVE